LDAAVKDVDALLERRMAMRRHDAGWLNVHLDQRVGLRGDGSTGLHRVGGTAGMEPLALGRPDDRGSAAGTDLERTVQRIVGGLHIRDAVTARPRVDLLQWQRCARPRRPDAGSPEREEKALVAGSGREGDQPSLAGRGVDPRMRNSLRQCDEAVLG
jgi:hypothetical protein